FGLSAKRWRTRGCPPNLSFCTELLLECVELPIPESAHARQPRIDRVESFGVERVEATLRVGAHANEVRLSQDLQMLRNGRRARVELAMNVARCPLTHREQLDDAKTRRIGKRSEWNHPL